jgi:hypothetical protein
MPQVLGFLPYTLLFVLPEPIFYLHRKPVPPDSADFTNDPQVSRENMVKNHCTASAATGQWGQAGSSVKDCQAMT